MPYEAIRRVNYNSSPICLTATNVARDFEQFHLPLNRLQNQLLHGMGILAGLDATIADQGLGVLVSAGAALDSQGRTIVLSESGTASFGDQPVSIPVPALIPLPSGQGAGSLDLLIEWGDEILIPIEPSSPTGCRQIQSRPRFRFAGGERDKGVDIVVCSVVVGENGKIESLNLAGRTIGTNATSVAEAVQEVKRLRKQVDETALSLSQLINRAAADAQTLSQLVTQVQSLKQRVEAPPVTTIWLHGSLGKLVEENGIAGPNIPFSKEDHGLDNLVLQFIANKAATIVFFIPLTTLRPTNSQNQPLTLRRIFVRGIGKEGAKIIGVEVHGSQTVLYSQPTDLTGDFSALGTANTFELSEPARVEGALAVTFRCQSQPVTPQRGGSLLLASVGVEFSS